MLFLNQTDKKMAQKGKLEDYQLIAYWHMNDWGKYGRRYEMCLKEIARRKIFRNIVLITPEIHYTVKGDILKKMLLKTLRIFFPYKVLEVEAGIKQFRTFYSFCKPQFLMKLNSYFLLLHILFYALWKKTIFLLYPYHPFIDKIIKIRNMSINKCIIVTDIVDDNTEVESYSEIKKENILDQYRTLVSISDIIFTTSVIMCDKFKEDKNKIFYLPNGVDSALIQISQNKTKKGMAGYIGFIDHRIDFQLVEKLLIAYPKIRFYFYGPVHQSCQEELERIRFNYDNFSYEGPIPYSCVKDKISEFDIGIIPHKKNRFVSSMSPLKIYQFLAQGKPVVSIDVLRDEQMESLVYCSKDPQEFCLNVEKALFEENPILKERRLKFVLENTWESRVNTILEKISLIL